MESKSNKIKKKTVSATADRGSYMNMNGKCGVFAAVADLKVGFLTSNGQPGPFGEPFVFSSRKYLLQIIISLALFFFITVTEALVKFVELWYKSKIIPKD